MNLCDHLREFCETSSLDLVGRLQRVRQSAESIWQNQRFEWFPDHTVAHSTRIIEHLGSVLCHLQNTGQRLNPHQLFILLASSYLHDIGMQDFRICGRTVDQLTIDDYEQIRERHAERSMELIVGQNVDPDCQAFRIDLEDARYIVPIALVSKAHSSAYFEDTVDELRSSPHRPGNQELRGDLLAALLLMADELDLHEARARFPPGLDLSPVAALHNYVHHYITEVKISDGTLSTQRRVQISFEYPSDSDAYKADIRWWVVSKLRRQMHRTQPVIQHSTNGQLDWENRVYIQEFTDKYGVRRQLPESAQLRLQYERAESQIIGRLGLVDTIKHALSASELQADLIEIRDEDESDWSQLLKWLIMAVRLHGAKLLHISFEFAIGRSPLDILEECYNRLTSSGFSCSAYETAKAVRAKRREDRSDRLCQALIEDLEHQAAVHRVIVLFERIDRADPETHRWLEESVLSELKRRQVPLLTIVTYRDSGICLGLGHCFRLEPFSQDTVAGHLAKRLGLCGQELLDKARGVYTLSRGIPLYLLDYLHVEEEQQFTLQRSQ